MIHRARLWPGRILQCSSNKRNNITNTITTITHGKLCRRVPVVRDLRFHKCLQMEMCLTCLRLAIFMSSRTSLRGAATTHLTLPTAAVKMGVYLLIMMLTTTNTIQEAATALDMETCSFSHQLLPNLKISSRTHLLEPLGRSPNRYHPLT